MAFVTQRVLEYSEHKDELLVLSRAIDLLGRRDISGALEMLVSRHAHLISAQRPLLKEFDQRDQLQRSRS